MKHLAFNRDAADILYFLENLPPSYNEEERWQIWSVLQYVLRHADLRPSAEQVTAAAAGLGYEVGVPAGAVLAMRQRALAPTSTVFGEKVSLYEAFLRLIRQVDRFPVPRKKFVAALRMLSCMTLTQRQCEELRPVLYQTASDIGFSGRLLEHAIAAACRKQMLHSSLDELAAVA